MDCDKRSEACKLCEGPYDSKKLHGHQLVWVLMSLKAICSVKRDKPKGLSLSTMLKDHIEDKHSDSIGSVTCKLDFNKSSIQRLLRSNLKMKPHKFYCA